MGAIFAFLIQAMPYIQLGVHLIEATAPAGTPGTVKKDAAMQSITTALQAASAAGSTVGKLHDALQASDSAGVANAVSAGIELAVSAAKSFGAFPKAGIVQNAPTLVDLLNMQQPPAGA